MAYAQIQELELNLMALDRLLKAGIITDQTYQQIKASLLEPFNSIDKPIPTLTPEELQQMFGEGISTAASLKSIQITPEQLSPATGDFDFLRNPYVPYPDSAADRLTAIERRLDAQAKHFSKQISILGTMLTEIKRQLEGK